MVEIGIRFIENEQFRFGINCAGDGQPLALASGKAKAALSDPCVQSGRQVHYHFVYARSPNGFNQRVGIALFKTRNVLFDGARDNASFLRHVTNIASAFAGFPKPNIDVIYLDRTLLEVLRADNDAAQG